MEIINILHPAFFLYLYHFENNIDKYVQNDKDKEKMLDVIYLLKAGKEMNE